MKKAGIWLILGLPICSLCACAQDRGHGAEGADVNLTRLSRTIVYSEVYNMLTHPGEYGGTTVRMHGKFSVYENPQNGARYFACAIADATACCSQGLEFVLNGTYAYPRNYPSLGSDVTVTGEFRTYEEEGNLYCHQIHANREQ